MPFAAFAGRTLSRASGVIFRCCLGGCVRGRDTNEDNTRGVRVRPAPRGKSFEDVGVYRCASARCGTPRFRSVSHDDGQDEGRTVLVPSSTSAPFASLSPEGRAPTLARVDSHRAGLRRRCRCASARAARHGPPVGSARDVPLRPSASRPQPRDHPQTSPPLPTSPRARPQAPPALAPTSTAVALPPDDPNLALVCCVARQSPRRQRGWISSPRRSRGRRARPFDFMRGGAMGRLRAVRMGDVPGDGSWPTPGTEGFEPATMEAAARRIAEAATEAEKTRAAEAQRGGARRGTPTDGRTLEPNHGRDTLGPPVPAVHLRG